ncbi:hypothetical protein OROHE_002202 [Orobanche hederae]
MNTISLHLFLAASRGIKKLDEHRNGVVWHAKYGYFLFGAPALLQPLDYVLQHRRCRSQDLGVRRNEYLARGNNINIRLRHFGGGVKRRISVRLHSASERGRVFSPDFGNFLFLSCFFIRALLRIVYVLGFMIFFGSAVWMQQLEACAHPFFDELREPNVRLQNGRPLPPPFNLKEEIHLVVSRLCASIEGTSPAHSDDCLGLDSKSTEAVVNELGTSLLSGLDADERDGVSTSNFWCKFCCPKCPEENESARLSPALIANQVKRQDEGFISRYYNGMMTDETCKYTTRGLNMGVLGDCKRRIVCPNYPCCNGRLVRQIKGNSKKAAEKKEARIRHVVELAAKTVQKIKDRCSYGWVMPNDLTVSI